MIQIKAKAPPKKPATTAKPKTTASKKLTQTTLKKPATKKRSKQDSDEENSDPDHSGDDSLLSNSPPAAKKQKKSPPPKKPAGRPLEPIDNESHGNMEQEVVKPKPKKGTATETYQKVNLHHHRSCRSPCANTLRSSHNWNTSSNVLTPTSAQ